MLQATTKIRHGPRFYDCTITRDCPGESGVADSRPNEVQVRLMGRDPGVCAGQYAGTIVLVLS
jgi:hypothetical protein